MKQRAHDVTLRGANAAVAAVGKIFRFMNFSIIRDQARTSLLHPNCPSSIRHRNESRSGTGCRCTQLPFRSPHSASCQQNDIDPPVAGWTGGEPDADGNVLIKGSRRPDGSYRPDIKVLCRNQASPLMLCSCSACTVTHFAMHR